MRSVTCSTSSSTKAFAFALAAAACAHQGAQVKAEPPLQGRIAVFPLDNLTGVPLPTREVQTEIERSLSIRGIPLVSGPVVDHFLALHRIRWTGGINRDSAAAAGAELGVSAVLITQMELYEATYPPRVAITMRIVSADARARVLWIDEVGRRGDDAPGLFDLGLVKDAPALNRLVVGALGDSLARWLRGA